MWRRFAWAWAGAILLSGCTTPSTDLFPAIQPDGGPSLVLNKPYELVFAAAVRAVTLQEDTISEASTEKGRIIAKTFFGPPRAVFFNRLPNGRTRVELSSAYGRALFTGFTLNPEGFFISLREQIVIYEKKEAIERERRREAEETEKILEGRSIAPSP